MKTPHNSSIPRARSKGKKGGKGSNSDKSVDAGEDTPSRPRVGISKARGLTAWVQVDPDHARTLRGGRVAQWEEVMKAKEDPKRRM